MATLPAISVCNTLQHDIGVTLQRAILDSTAALAEPALQELSDATL